MSKKSASVTRCNIRCTNHNCIGDSTLSEHLTALVCRNNCRCNTNNTVFCCSKAVCLCVAYNLIISFDFVSVVDTFFFRQFYCSCETIPDFAFFCRQSERWVYHKVVVCQLFAAIIPGYTIDSYHIESICVILCSKCYRAVPQFDVVTAPKTHNSSTVILCSNSVFVYTCFLVIDNTITWVILSFISFSDNNRVATVIRTTVLSKVCIHNSIRSGPLLRRYYFHVECIAFFECSFVLCSCWENRYHRKEHHNR